MGGVAFILLALLGARFISLYSLWDDEATTALFAQSVRETGDTRAIRGQNIIAFRGGAELNSSLKARYVSPLQYYFLAPFIGLETTSSTQARFPFFILTLLSVLLIYRRFLKENWDVGVGIGFFTLSIGLVSFLLFGVQCRYYSMTFLFTTLLVDVYFFERFKAPWQWILFGIWGALLFASNYLIAAGVLGAFAVHAIVFRIGFFKKNLRRVVWIVLPHILISVPVFLVWNPLNKSVVSVKNSLSEKVSLLYWNIRDFNTGHLGPVLLLLLGIFLFGSTSRQRFRQYAVMFFTYLVFVSWFSPQAVSYTNVADIRYLYPLMLLGFAWTIDFWMQFKSEKLGHYFFALGIAFFSFTSLPYNGQMRFPLWELVSEIRSPAGDPYQKAADWLNANADSGSKVRVSLSYAAYPLMYLAPQFHYIGQFQSEENLPFDYFLSFCDGGYTARPSKMVARIPSVCRDAYRPEFFWRSFGKNQILGSIEVYRVGAD